MQIDAVWKRWTEILAALFIAVHEKWRARQALLIAFENTRLIVRHGGPTGNGAGLRPELPDAAGLRDAARRHFITLELPAEEIVLQRLNLPAQARDYLPGIVRNQIERLSPWSADQVVYGFDAVASPEDPTILDARVLMTSQTNVEAARAALAALGVSADRIVAREQGAASAPSVTLWSRYDSGPGQGLEQARKLIGAAVLILIGASLGLSAWGLVSANATRAESEDVAVRSATLQRQLQPSRASLPSASLDPAERAWILKETSPSGVAILEMLSRALPDQAYVTELSLQKATVRIVGLSNDAPSLIAPLERIGQFAEVHFFAPTTRGPDGKLFWFHIEARVEPHIEVSER